MDKLFDSVNNSFTVIQPGKELRSAVTSTSIHWQFWKDALLILESMNFGTSNVPTIKNWISTIKGFQYLCKKLLNSGFKFVSLRLFNQDPVENFFCQVRSHGLRNTNPTCFHFQNSFKSLLINNLISPQSVGANCQKDNCENLTTLKQLLTLNKSSSNIIQINPQINLSSITQNVVIPQKSKLALSCQTYVAGAIVNKLKKLTSNCKFCLETLKSTNVKNDQILKATQYNNCSLQTPSIISTNIYAHILSEFNSTINLIFKEPNIKLYFLNNINPKLKMTNICIHHDTKHLFISAAFNLLMFAFTANVNRVLKGEKLKMLCSEEGTILCLAENYYKHFKMKKHKILKNCNKL